MEGYDLLQPPGIGETRMKKFLGET